MATARDEATWEASAPDPRSLAVVLLVGLASVLFLPRLAPHLPHIGTDREAQWALTGAGLFALFGAFVFVEGRRRGLSIGWTAWTWAYAAGLLVVKFVLSPSAFTKTDKSLTAFVVTGLVVLLLYLAGLATIAVMVGRSGVTWSRTSQVMLAVVLAGAAVIVRIIAAVVLGTASTYFHDLARGTGLILPGLVLLASIAVMESYRLDGPNQRHAFLLSVVVVVTLHALWVVYMYQLFS